MVHLPPTYLTPPILPLERVCRVTTGKKKQALWWDKNPDLTTLLLTMKEGGDGMDSFL